VNIVWAPDAWNEYVDWQSRDPKIAAKINTLISDIRRNPFSGMGKPEPLKAEFASFWSRRITEEHRLVYRVTGKRGQDQRLEIAQCRLHY
jgi:toxin YoeB